MVPGAMILVGIDDTDNADSPGTNRLARALALELGGCTRIVRHQLLVDPRIPYTSKNSAASLWFESGDAGRLVAAFRDGLRARCAPGSDPGLCVAEAVPAALREFGRVCRETVTTQAEARALARRQGVHLEGLGGTEDGVIGALAAVGLAATGDDGRVVHLGAHPDDLSGWQDVAFLRAAGVDEVRCHGDGSRVGAGRVDIGKRLRPNLRAGRVVLFVEPAAPGAWRAVRLL